MGCLVFQNCEEKWGIICPATAKDPKYKTPSKQENPKCHATKWTDGKIGQQAGGGWDPKAYDVFYDLQKFIQDQRTEDQKNGWPIYKEILRAVRIAKEITMPEPIKKKSRKRNQEEQLAPKADRPRRQRAKITYHFGDDQE